MKTLFDQIKVSITANHPKSAAVDVWVIPVFKDEKLSPELKKIDNELHGTISEWIDQDFIQNDKEKNTWFTIKNSSFKTSNFLFMSMGKKKDFTRNSARDVFGTASKLCNNRGFHRVGIFEFGLKEIPLKSHWKDSCSDLTGSLITNLKKVHKDTFVTWKWPALQLH